MVAPQPSTAARQPGISSPQKSSERVGLRGQQACPAVGTQNRKPSRLVGSHGRPRRKAGRCRTTAVHARRSLAIWTSGFVTVCVIRHLSPRPLVSTGTVQCLKQRVKGKGGPGGERRLGSVGPGARRNAFQRRSASSRSPKGPIRGAGALHVRQITRARLNMKPTGRQPRTPELSGDSARRGAGPELEEEVEEVVVVSGVDIVCSLLGSSLVQRHEPVD
ncbi:unnamed protein product [Menidia menidia]|uniref:(Atlantic silverside) hypothetical protein n=1 Tax=Menidia menidia TaxID=238744 RepID=A0A8S4BS37_9TELE|nr:unnamed protein product [Menidia menidia]